MRKKTWLWLLFLIGEVSDSGSGGSGSDSGPDEFFDGYDENMMGDEEDRKRLAQMSEMEREKEIYNRIEKREVLKTRQEIISYMQSSILFSEKVEAW